MRTSYHPQPPAPTCLVLIRLVLLCNSPVSPPSFGGSQSALYSLSPGAPAGEWTLCPKPHIEKRALGFQEKELSPVYRA